MGNRSEGAEFCGNDCGAASPGSGRCLGFSADCTYMAGRQPYHEKAAIQNATFQADEDFDYYREKLTGVPPATSLLMDLQIEAKKTWRHYS